MQPVAWADAGTPRPVQRLLGHLREVRAAGGEVVEFCIRPLILRLRLRHVHGPQRIPYGRHELIVLCVVRDGALHVKSFLEHHLALGVAHIVLLDNGSTDATIDLARRYDRVTILHTTCPYRKYETILKRYLVDRFSRDRWSLFVDIDERFDYPYSDVIDLGGLLAYLNEHSYTAVVAQMLDMFGDGPLDRPDGTPEDTLEDKYPYYDISAVEKHDYVFGRPANFAIKMHSGGSPQDRVRHGQRTHEGGVDPRLVGGHPLRGMAPHGRRVDRRLQLCPASLPLREHLLQEGRGGRAYRSIPSVGERRSTRNTGSRP